MGGSTAGQWEVSGGGEMDERVKRGGRRRRAYSNCGQCKMDC